MKRQIEFEKRCGKNFQTALIKLRLILTLMNGFLLFVILNKTLTWLDYTIIGGYLSLILGSFLIKFKAPLFSWLWSSCLLMIDFLIWGCVLVRTGGISSRFFSLSFIIIFATALRYQYLGVIFWSIIGSIILGSVCVITGQENFNLWFLKSSSLFLMSFSSVFLIKNIYTKDEYEREYEQVTELTATAIEPEPEPEPETDKQLTLDEIFTETLNAVHKGKLGLMAAVMLFDNHGQLKIYASIGWEEAWLQHYQQHILTQKSLVLAPILVFKRPLLAVNIVKHPELTTIFEVMPVESFSAFPFVFEGEVIGILMLINSKLKDFMVDEEERLLRIAKRMSWRLEEFVKNKSNKKECKGEIDEVTGLYNQTYYEEQFEELIYWAQLREVPLSLILLDFEELEKYYQNFNLQAGNQFLRKIGLILREVVGKQGIAARCSKDKLALILWNVDRISALKYGEIIIYRFERMIAKDQVRIALGIGNMPEHAKDRITLFEYTQMKLAEAKNKNKQFADRISIKK